MLLYRVFRMIEQEHFEDHKMIPYYCNSIRFARGVGDDLANYVQAKFPKLYHKKRKYYAREQ